MRADMFKVIVERPRGWKNLRGPANSCRNDFESPIFMGMRVGYGYRALNENLAPLRRFLESQVGRPWNKVYSEICETIDTRSTVKQHILQHVEDFVATHTWRQEDSIWCVSKHWSEPMPLSHTRQRLYVDPKSGLLRKNTARDNLQAAQQRERLNNHAEATSHRRMINDRLMLLRIEGIWYEVGVASLRDASYKPSNKKAWCVVRKALVSMENGDSFNGSRELGNRQLLGKHDLFAVSKVQLNKAALRKFGLVD